MKLRQSHRIPALLLACLVVSLLFPEACSGARVRMASWLPATAAASAPSDERIADLEEREAQLMHDLRVATEARNAVPDRTEGPLADALLVARPRGARAVLVPARVLHVDASSSRRSFVIDVGSEQGLRRGLAVVHGNSLVGVLKTVGHGASRVLRVDDVAKESVLPAVILTPASESGGIARARGTGVARGTGENALRVSFLAQGEARVGDLVVTGAGSESVPEGLVLGRVSLFDDADRNGNWEAVVEPLRDLDALSAVLVVKRDPLPPEVAPR